MAFKKVQIISVDNYDREGPIGDEDSIIPSISEHYAMVIVLALNDVSPDGQERYFKIVPLDHKLKTFVP